MTLARVLSFIVLIAIILVIGALFYRVMSTFLIPLFLSAVLAVLMWPIHARILAWTGGRSAIAAAISTIVMILMIVLPIAFVSAMASVEVLALVRESKSEDLQGRVLDIRKYAGLDVPLSEITRRLEAHVVEIGELERTERLAPGSAADAAQRKDRMEDHLAQLQSGLANLKAHPDSLPLDTYQPLESAVETIKTEVDQSKDRAPRSDEFHQQLVTLQTEFDALSREVYGAGSLGQIRKLANPTEDEIRSWSKQALLVGRDWLFDRWGESSGEIGGFLLGVVILLVATYFFFLDGPAMIRAGMRLSPLDDKYEEELLDEFDRASRAVVLALVLAALAQGLLAGLAYAVLGVPSMFLLTVATTILAFIPFVGAGGVYIPVALGLWLLADRPWAAILLAVWGVGVVSTVDNLIKPWILHGQSRLNPLLALLSVIGGVKALGPVGLLLGPMIAIYMTTLLRILQREVTSLDADSLSAKITGNRSARQLRPYSPKWRPHRLRSPRPS